MNNSKFIMHSIFLLIESAVTELYFGGRHAPSCLVVDLNVVLMESGFGAFCN